MLMAVASEKRLEYATSPVPCYPIKVPPESDTLDNQQQKDMQAMRSATEDYTPSSINVRMTHTTEGVVLNWGLTNSLTFSIGKSPGEGLG